MTRADRVSERAAMVAIHELDLIEVGWGVGVRWDCAICGCPQTGTPAAFVKKQTGLTPLCLVCISEGRRVDGLAR